MPWGATPRGPGRRPPRSLRCRNVDRSRVGRFHERRLKGVPEPIRVFRLLDTLAPLPQLGPLPPPDGNEGRGEVSRHLRAAAQAAARQAEEVLPRLPDKLRVFIGAGLAAMMAVATAFFALARPGALPWSGRGKNPS